jgi:hypothetical protein
VTQPAKLKLAGFKNLVGHHCSSSAVRSVLAYDGVEVSEALVFGLGNGLGFFYSVEPEGSPTRRFNGRAPDLEGNLFALAGRPIAWAGAWRPELIEEALASGRPLLAQTDIHPIPYYDDAHFIGHGIAIVGLIVGLEKSEVVVADIAAEGLSRMPLEAFREAVSYAYWPLLEPYRYGAAPRLEGLDVAELAPRAIARTAAYMLRPPSPQEGISGLRMMAEDLPEWRGLSDLGWACRFAYQAIEKRGTGGGGFRRLYRDFLAEVAPWVPGIDKGVISGFGEAADVWAALAQAFKAAAFEDASEIERAAALTQEIAGLEEALLGSLSAAFG